MSIRVTLSNLTRRLFEWNGLRWMTFGLVVSSDIVQFLKGIQYLLPFGNRNNNCFFLAVIVHDVFFMNWDHRNHLIFIPLIGDIHAVRVISLSHGTTLSRLERQKYYNRESSFPQAPLVRVYQIFTRFYWIFSRF